MVKTCKKCANYFVITLFLRDFDNFIELTLLPLFIDININMIERYLNFKKTSKNVSYSYDIFVQKYLLFYIPLRNTKQKFRTLK